MESRTQGSRPRPRTQKKSEAKAKDSLSKDRHSRGEGQECSRPRLRTKDTSASAQKKVFTEIFQAISTKKRFQKIFQTLHKILTIQKILLSSSRGQANFRGLEASRPRSRTSKCVLEDYTSGIHNWFGTNKLSINFTKTKYVLFRILRSKPLPSNLSLSVHGKRIERIYEINFLGITYNENLSWKKHMLKILGNIRPSNGATRKIRFI